MGCGEERWATRGGRISYGLGEIVADRTVDEADLPLRICGLLGDQGKDDATGRRAPNFCGPAKL